MPGTLFFVHGTGVRQGGFKATLERIREGCAKQPKLAGVTIADTCNWGHDVGTKMDLLQLVLPPEERTRSIASAVSDEDIELALWGLLLEDPLFELRLAAQQPPKSVSVFGQQAPDVTVAEELNRVAADPPDVTESDLPPAAIASALKTVAAAAFLAPAATAAGDAADPDLVEAIARATVAQALVDAPTDAPRPRAATDRQVRDELVTKLAAAIAPQTRGPIGWLRNKVKETVAGVATSQLRSRRDSLTGGALPKVGDIFFHLRRGDVLLDYIEDRLRGWPEPIVAVGHSLGGVLLVDLLNKPGAPKVDALVTVGSQAALFYAVDALGTLRPRTNPPAAPFVPWLNIYDRNDFLSYVAADVFGPASGIRDVEVKSGVPFPDAHNAYWELDRTYELIANAWP